MIDLTPVANALLALAAAVVTAAIPIVVPAAMKRLKIANNADLATRIEAAATAGAGLAYRYAVAHEGGLANIPVQDMSLALGVNHVVQSVPDALTTLGITPEHVQQMVTARLGALLASDPTVTAGTPTALPSPVQTVKPDPGVAATPGTAEPLSTAA